MKAFLGVLFLTLALPGGAQAPSPESIFIGDFGEVQLFLGESKDSALRALREGFDVGSEDSKTGQVAVFSLGTLSPGAKVGHLYAWVTFHNGKMFAVTKPWPIHSNTGVDVVRAIRGAVSSFGTPGRVCSVQSFDDHEPSAEKSGVVVFCGKRQVQIFTSAWRPVTGTREDVVVNEVLSSGP